MHLLVCVINNTNKTDDILSGFLEIGITGATVIDSHGMADLITEDTPIFAGFQSLLHGDRQPNRTIFSVIREQEKLDLAMALIEDVCGDMNEPSTGIMFALPVSHVKGLAAELG